MTAAGLLLCDDLLFASKVTATARAHGATVAVCRTGEQLAARLTDGPRAIVLDLQNPTLDLGKVADWKAAGARVVAFGSHVDKAALQAARAAGCDVVLPRSKFVADLETQLAEWLS